jgi:predicted F0F1-ATPase subunit
MTERPGRFHRGNARERTRRDLDRWQRREPDAGFWRSLALIGSVGWPIVLSAVSGAALGRALDRHFGMGIRCSLMLLGLGTAFGTWIAFRTLQGDSRGDRRGDQR